MKQLDKLFGEVEKEDKKLDDFLATAPILLDDSQEYRFEIRDDVVEIYGLTSGIDDYAIQRSARDSVKEEETRHGIALLLSHKSINRVVLRSDVYKKNNEQSNVDNDVKPDDIIDDDDEDDYEAPVSSGRYDDWERHARMPGTI